jgi:hypothetical protein
LKKWVGHEVYTPYVNPSIQSFPGELRTDLHQPPKTTTRHPHKLCTIQLGKSTKEEHDPTFQCKNTAHEQPNITANQNAIDADSEQGVVRNLVPAPRWCRGKRRTKNIHHGFWNRPSGGQSMHAERMACRIHWHRKTRLFLQRYLENRSALTPLAPLPTSKYMCSF